MSVKLHEEMLGMKRIESAEGMRLEAFLMLATKGSFVLHKFGHAFAVVDGVVHDWQGTTKAGTTVLRAWKVTDKAKAKMEALAKMV